MNSSEKLEEYLQKHKNKDFPQKKYYKQIIHCTNCKRKHKITKIPYIAICECGKQLIFLGELTKNTEKGEEKRLKELRENDLYSLHKR